MHSLRPFVALASAALLGACASVDHPRHAPAADAACPCETAAPAAPAARTDSPVAGAAAYASAVKVTRLLQTTTDAAGRPLSWPDEGPAQLTAVHVEIAPGGSTGWHIHPLPCAGYVLEGELEISLIDGRKHVVRAGEALAEMVNFQHEGRNASDKPARLVMFVIGVEGKPFTVKTAGPADAAPSAK